MIVARILSPSEIGVYSVTMALSGFLATFRDLGASQYLVQKAELSDRDIRAIWSLQIVLGLSFALVIVATAKPVAVFYGQPSMFSIMVILGLNFAVTPFLAFPNAWLVRDMRFGTIAILRSCGSLFHALTAIGMAWLGFGPVSLAWANTMTTLSGIVLVWIIAKPRQMPWIPSFVGVSEVASFGSKLTVASFLNALAAGAPELFLGKLQGMVEAGLFGRALGLVSIFQKLFMEAVGAVTLPYFAKRSREASNLAEPFLATMEITTGVGWAFFGGIAILSQPCIRALYGEQWDGAIEPARWLAIGAAISLISSVCTNPMIAIGAVGRVLKATAWSTIFIVAAVMIGALGDLLVVSKLLICASFGSALIWLYFTWLSLQFGLRDLWNIMLKSCALSLGSVIVPLMVMFHFGWNSTEIVLPLLTSALGGSVGFLIAAYLVDHRIWKEIHHLVSQSFGGGTRG